MRGTIARAFGGTEFLGNGEPLVEPGGSTLFGQLMVSIYRLIPVV